MARTLLPPSSKSSRLAARELGRVLSRYPEVRKSKRAKKTRVGIATVLLVGALVAGVFFGASAGQKVLRGS